MGLAYFSDTLSPRIFGIEVNQVVVPKNIQNKGALAEHDFLASQKFAHEIHGIFFRGKWWMRE